MKYIDEYRDPHAARQLADAIQTVADKPSVIMEVCGGQTHAIIKYGIDELLPDTVTLIHGPGCPVCVTDAAVIDQAIELASKSEVILCTFGDMLRVPGSERDLFSARALGGDVRIVYSPLDALELAKKNPERQTVFFAVGFETTAPTTAMLAYQAKRQGVQNLSLLTAHVRVPPAMEALLSAPDNRVQGFLAAGHVCTVMGYEEYPPIASRYGTPIVVTGFEPVDILQGIYLCLQQLSEGRAEVENQYSRSVRREGNRNAMRLLEEVYEPAATVWRGLGEIPESGLKLRKAYAEFDAGQRFGPIHTILREETECISGLILRGAKKPHECPAFAKRCTPENPLGAPMVSAEGACAAYYRYRRHGVGG